MSIGAHASTIGKYIINNPKTSAAIAGSLAAVPFGINQIRSLSNKEYTGPGSGFVNPSTTLSLSPLLSGAASSYILSNKIIRGRPISFGGRANILALGAIPGLLAGALPALAGSYYVKSKENDYMEKPWIARKIIEKYIGSLPVLGSLS